MGKIVYRRSVPIIIHFPDINKLLTTYVNVLVTIILEIYETTKLTVNILWGQEPSPIGEVPANF